MARFSSFLRLNHISPYTHIFFIHTSTKLHLCCFHIFPTVNNAGSTHTSSRSCFHFSGYIPNPLGLLDYVVVLFLSFLRNLKILFLRNLKTLFSTMFVLIFISNKQCRRVLFLHIGTWVASACSSLK